MGVAIVLSGPAVHAWKSGGSKWRAWSSRQVIATLDVGGGNGGKLHVLSCYAPTFAASRDEKDAFFDTLQQALSAIPVNECYVMLGDFNARVGSRLEGDMWWYERGPHGYGDLNEAGRELLTFLAINEATVCNTWFMKRDISKQTRQHPKSKRWHCIDYVIMRKAHRRKCLNVAVVRGADCNTDHRMVRMKMIVGRNRAYGKERVNAGVKRWDVAKLQGGSVDARGRMTARGKYLSGLKERVCESWVEEGSVSGKWEVLKAAMCDEAEAVLGYEDRRQPDWCRERDGSQATAGGEEQAVCFVAEHWC